MMLLPSSFHGERCYGICLYHVTPNALCTNEYHHPLECEAGIASYPGFLAPVVLQATDAGARRPGYEAKAGTHKSQTVLLIAVYV